jgi:hypothetical protein
VIISYSVMVHLFDFGSGRAAYMNDHGTVPRRSHLADLPKLAGADTVAHLSQRARDRQRSGLQALVQNVKDLVALFNGGVRQGPLVLQSTFEDIGDIATLLQRKKDIGQGSVRN